jgi:hypothetical protein
MYPPPSLQGALKALFSSKFALRLAAHQLLGPHTELSHKETIWLEILLEPTHSYTADAPAQQSR